MKFDRKTEFYSQLDNYCGKNTRKNHMDIEKIIQNIIDTKLHT